MTSVPGRLAAALADRYRIERELGQGGMATVYLAADLKHDRNVAIKVLKPELAAVLGAERFVQEIKTTAQLSHPHILPLFDSGEAGGFLYYVMPYIQGETIRDKLNREAQFGIDETVRIGTEVADALDYAHRHGVIHRDIKPENILLHDGRPMVMDFGIALAVSAAAGGRMTETGLSLGTPHYMSPEQATADKALTARSDIYSLASVLYEMLAGVPPHEGGSAQQVIMRIIAETAKPVTELRKSVPPHVAATLARALEKVPADRFTSASEFAQALKGELPMASVSRASDAQGEANTRWRGIALAASGVAVALAGLLLWSLGRSSAGGDAGRPIEFSFGATLARSTRQSIAISPDGRLIVLPVPDSNGVVALVARDLGASLVAPIPGTARARDFSFSPDGKWLAYDSDERLYKIPAAGGTPVVLVDSIRATASSWAANGWILFTAGGEGLWRVRESGGSPERLTSLDSTRREFAHWYPSELPGGKVAIYNSFSAPISRSRIDAVEYATGRITTLVEGAVFGRYVDGYLLYVRDGAIFAAPFDPQRLELVGPSVPVVEDVAWSATGGLAGYAVSTNGTLTYLKASAWRLQRRVVWVDRDGGERPALPEVGFWAEPRLSPNGRWLAVTGLEPTYQIWLADRSRQVLTQLSRSSEASFNAVWMPDSRSIIHTIETPVYDLARTSLDGATTDTILRSRSDKQASSVSPDGRTVAYTEFGDEFVIGFAPLDGAGGAGLDRVGGAGKSPAFSPDGRWLAYEELLANQSRIFVRPVAGGPRRQVSAGGGDQPRWTRGGRELVFRNGGVVYAASFEPATGDVGTPVRLFAKPDVGRLNVDRTIGYDVTPDGSQFLMVVPVPRPNAEPVVVIVNWLDDLRRKVPR